MAPVSSTSSFGGLARTLIRAGFFRSGGRFSHGLRLGLAADAPPSAPAATRACPIPSAGCAMGGSAIKWTPITVGSQEDAQVDVATIDPEHPALQPATAQAPVRAPLGVASRDGAHRDPA